MRKIKVGIITFSRAINYGAVMQMYALQYYLTVKLDCICDIIDYRSAEIEKEYKKITAIQMLNPKVIGSILIKNSYINFNKKGFQKFCDKNIKFSEKTCYNKDSLEKLEDEYDLFITGSDQVFNLYCSHYDTSYFLDFITDKSKKNSYAASLGLKTIPVELEKKYKELLDNFNYLSVREKTAANEIYRLTEKKCTVNVDPTLLLREKWYELANYQRVPNYPYVLVYGITEDKALFDIAKKVAQKKESKVLYISDRLFNPTGAIRLKNVNPDEWLGLINKAQAVVTNSYHGILFSCNFHKEFYPLLLDKNQQVNSRIIDYLEKLHLVDILLNNHDDHSDVKNMFDVDYDEVDKIIEIEKTKSYTYLNQMIADIRKRQGND